MTGGLNWHVSHVKRHVYIHVGEYSLRLDLTLDFVFLHIQKAIKIDRLLTINILIFLSYGSTMHLNYL